MYNHKERRVLRKLCQILLIFLIFVLNSCTATSPKIVKSQERDYSVEASKQILVLNPKITFERVDNPEKISAEASKQENIGLWILDLTEKEIQRKGFTEIISGEKMGEQKETIKRLEDLSNILVRSTLSEDNLRMLSNVSGAHRDRAVLVHCVRVKVGHDRTWELIGLPPLWVGLIPKVSLSNSYIRAVIRNCEDGSVIWRNDVFIRSVPLLGDKIFKNGVVALYQNLLIREELK